MPQAGLVLADADEPSRNQARPAEMMVKLIAQRLVR